MWNRVVVALMALAAVVEGLMPEMVPENSLPIALVILGLVWGWMGVDAEDATAYLAVAVGVGLAAQSDALSNLPAVGPALDAILGQASVALYSAVATIMAVRTWNRVKA